LMIGGNLPDNRALEQRLLGNPEVLAVNQEGMNPREVVHDAGRMIWVSDAGSGALYVGVFNIGDSAREMAVDIRRTMMVRDLWARKDLGKFTKKYSRVLPAHGCMLLKIIPYL